MQNVTLSVLPFRFGADTFKKTKRKRRTCDNNLKFDKAPYVLKISSKVHIDHLKEVLDQNIVSSSTYLNKVSDQKLRTGNIILAHVSFKKRN